MVITKENGVYIARYQGRTIEGHSFADAITKMLALIELETLPEADFQVFFKSLPARVQTLVRGGLSDWRTVLPQWYLLRAYSL